MEHNRNNSGIFVMRHMETFMGDINTWKPGFMNEGPKQDEQIAILRKKYVNKIFSHSQNGEKVEMMKEVDRYHSANPAIKARLQKIADDSRHERLLT